MTYTRLFRVPNLLIVALTLWLLAKYSLYPTLAKHDIVPLLASKDVLLIIFVALCIMAGGYLMNDYYDYETDTINDKRHYLRSRLERISAKWIYAALCILPLPMVYMLAYEVRHPEYMALYPASILLLWLYNRWLKRLPLIGNVLVAALCAAVIVIPLLAEYDSLAQLKSQSLVDYHSLINLWGAYAAFAFVSNLMREISKDAEDIEGDKAIGARTIPILMGVDQTRMVLLIIHGLFLALLTYWTFSIDAPSQLTIPLLFIPSISLFPRIWRAKDQDTYQELSLYLKLFMLAGLFFLFFYLKQ